MSSHVLMIEKLNGGRLRLTLVFLYVEHKLTMEKTKEVMKEIAQQFEDVNKELGTEKCSYHFKFARYSCLDIPPPAVEE